MKKIINLLLIALFLCSCSKHSTLPNGGLQVNDLPQLHTNDISQLTRFSVVFGGRVYGTSGAKITEMGFVVDTVPGPTVARNFNKFVVPQFDSANVFQTTVGALPSLQTYYLRAYAVDTFGIGYGNEIMFTTLLNKVYNGIVTLSTQQEVIDFGANHYNTINGDLDISGSVTDLTPLLGLVAINNAFNVKNSALVNFKGLDSLEATGVVFPNGFFIEYNNDLVNFTGLGRLKSSRGVAQIDFNPALQNMDGLDSYAAAGAGELRITDCGSLQNLNGLKELYFVGEDLYIDNDPVLTDVSGLSSLSSVYGRIYFINDASLQNLHGLEGVRNPDGGVELDQDPVLSDISALSNLESIPATSGIGALVLNGDPMIKNLSPFSKLATVPNVTIDNCGGLVNLQGLGGLKTVGFLEIDGDSALKDLSGLTSLKGLSRLTVTSNPLLVSLHGLDALTSITTNGYSIIVSRNNSLVTLDGLENVSRADGSVQVLFDPVLTDFCPLKLLFNSGYNQWFLTQGDGSNPTQAQVVSGCQ